MGAAFHFTESEWDKISVELGRTGRLKCEGDRQILEMICGAFAQLRPRLGRNAPTPARARDAWGKVAAAARKLEVAIAGLRAAGAADFTFLDNHQGGMAGWAAQLPFIVEAAKGAAQLEMGGTRTVSNAADPMCDGFVKQLALIWVSYGGRISHTEDGPLIRFLSAATAPALFWADEEPMTTDALRGSVRRIRMAS
jgi:hypothetical protein